MLAWHWVTKDRKITHREPGKSEPELIEVGRTYHYGGELALSLRGLHASVNALDALEYAPGPVICRVKLSGEIIEDQDKLVTSERTVLWLADAELALIAFAEDLYQPGSSLRWEDANRISLIMARGTAELAASRAVSELGAWDSGWQGQFVSQGQIMKGIAAGNRSLVKYLNTDLRDIEKSWAAQAEEVYTKAYDEALKRTRSEHNARLEELLKELEPK